MWRAYRVLRVVIGHRAAHWLTEMLPGFAVAAIGLLIYTLLSFAIGPTTGPDIRNECGMGPIKWDC